MGRIETDPIPDQVQMLAQEVYTIDLLPLLANNMARLDFEVGPLVQCFPSVWGTNPGPPEMFWVFPQLTTDTLTFTIYRPRRT